MLKLKIGIVGEFKKDDLGEIMRVIKENVPIGEIYIIPAQGVFTDKLHSWTVMDRTAKAFIKSKASNDSIIFLLVKMSEPPKLDFKHQDMPYFQGLVERGLYGARAAKDELSNVIGSYVAFKEWNVVVHSAVIHELLHKWLPECKNEKCVMNNRQPLNNLNLDLCSSCKEKLKHPS